MRTRSSLSTRSIAPGCGTRTHPSSSSVRWRGVVSERQASVRLRRARTWQLAMASNSGLDSVKPSRLNTLLLSVFQLYIFWAVALAELRVGARRKARVMSRRDPAFPPTSTLGPSRDCARTCSCAAPRAWGRSGAQSRRRALRGQAHAAATRVGACCRPSLGEPLEAHTKQLGRACTWELLAGEGPSRFAPPCDRRARPLAQLTAIAKVPRDVALGPGERDFVHLCAQARAAHTFVHEMRHVAAHGRAAQRTRLQLSEEGA